MTAAAYRVPCPVLEAKSCKTGPPILGAHFPFQYVSGSPVAGSLVGRLVGESGRGFLVYSPASLLTGA